MNPRLRLLINGRPKAGKTGLLATLLNAGFQVGLLDFDNNPDPLQVYADPATRDANLSVITLRDELQRGPQGNLLLADEPTAMLRAAKALDDWGRVDPKHPWGSVRKWGPNRVLAVDSLTGMGDACYNLICFLNNRKSLTQVPDWVWGAAMKEEDQQVARFMGPEFHCHVLLTAHVKLIGPRVERSEKGEDEDLVTAKAAITKSNAELMPTRYYPTALGKALPQDIVRRVPAAIYVEAEAGKRAIWTQNREDLPMDLGVPGFDDPKRRSLPHPSGILDIMEAVCGYREPPQLEEAA